MNHRSCLLWLCGAVVSLNQKLLKMESGVSDSRSIGSGAHLCCEDFTLGQVWFPCSFSPQKLWLSSLCCTDERCQRQYCFLFLCSVFNTIFGLCFLNLSLSLSSEFMMLVQLFLISIHSFPLEICTSYNCSFQQQSKITSTLSNMSSVWSDGGSMP